MRWPSSEKETKSAKMETFLIGFLLGAAHGGAERGGHGDLRAGVGGLLGGQPRHRPQGGGAHLPTTTTR